MFVGRIFKDRGNPLKLIQKFFVAIENQGIADPQGANRP